MESPLLYRFVRLLTRITTSIYFRKIEITARGRIPATGPVILAANHPQSIADTLVLGLASGRMLHYLAHSGLFHSQIHATFLRACGVIPVHRPRDVGDAAERNLATFESCYRALEGGGAIGIFPEGTSQEERRVQRLRTGTARIALEAEARNDFSLGVAIIPIGLSFESRRRFRSRVLVNVGEPVPVGEYRTRYETDGPATVHAITDLLEERLASLVVSVDALDLEEVVADAEAVYKGELLSRGDDGIPGSSPFKKDQHLSREISRAVRHFQQHDPARVDRLGRRLREYRRKLDRVRLPEAILREEGGTFAGAATRLLVIALIGLPLAVWGAVWNYVPYRITGLIAAGKEPDLTKTHTTRILWGIPVVLIYYPLVLWWLHSGVGTGWTIAIGLSFIPAGLFAHRYAGQLQRRRKLLRFAYLRATSGMLLAKLDRDRRTLIAELDRAGRDYASHQESP